MAFLNICWVTTQINASGSYSLEAKISFSSTNRMSKGRKHLDMFYVISLEAKAAYTSLIIVNDLSKDTFMARPEKTPIQHLGMSRQLMGRGRQKNKGNAEKREDIGVGGFNKRLSRTFRHRRGVSGKAHFGALVSMNIADHNELSSAPLDFDALPQPATRAPPGGPAESQTPYSQEGRLYANLFSFHIFFFLGIFYISSFLLNFFLLQRCSLTCS